MGQQTYTYNCPNCDTGTLEVYVIDFTDAWGVRVKTWNDLGVESATCDCDLTEDQCLVIVDEWRISAWQSYYEQIGEWPGPEPTELIAVAVEDNEDANSTR